MTKEREGERPVVNKAMWSSMLVWRDQLVMIMCELPLNELKNYTKCKIMKMFRLDMTSTGSWSQLKMSESCATWYNSSRKRNFVTKCRTSPI